MLPVIRVARDKMRYRLKERLLSGPLLGRLSLRKRVPVLLQLSAVECGATCLAMVLCHHGRKTAVSEVRERCAVGRDGLKAISIVNAAREYGLRTKAYSLEPENLKHIKLPAIIHWGFNHFVVLERWSPRRAEIIDPSEGRRQLTPEEFKQYFTGIVISFEPGAQFNRDSAARPPSSLWDYFAALFSSSSAKGLLAQILLASLLLQVFGLAIPVFTKVLFDHVFPARNVSLLGVYTMTMVAVVFAQTLSSYMRSIFLIYLRGRLDSQMMLGFVEHLFSLPFSFFQQRTSGDLLMRLNSNSILREVITNQTLSVLLDGLFLLLYLNFLLVAAPGFSLLVLALGIAQTLILVGTRHRIRSLTQQNIVANAKEQSYLVEAVKGIAFLKGSGAEDRAFDHWSNLFFKELNTSLERGHVAALIETALTALRALAPVLLLWLGATYVLDRQLSVGTMMALYVMAAMFLTPLAALVATGQQLQMAGAHLERLSDVMEARPEQAAEEGQRPRKLSGRVELRNVSFKYNRDSDYILKNVSFKIEPGQKVALVGATGSGKSTLISLLLGLFSPTEGEIYYDGGPLSELNYRGLRSQFGLVLQEPVLFSGSIRQNITFGNQNLVMADIVEAAHLACIHEDILKMPMGYETVISEGGTNVSGGQRQRLAIARALAGKPAFLLLDEATSHLDLLTESLVDQHLSDLSCTRIVVAHRLSTIRNADQILVLKDGAIIEHGTHEELIRQGGNYAELLQSQESADCLQGGAELSIPA